ncbi:hypothetical protein B0H21DRAFT_709745 [Amylocystis lapponica]|nr:hypothetical protein B0H21DRAFT_709745 [Amylocystis lapponica]
MKSVAVVSLFASVALASSSSLIPSGISDNCTSYLKSFNQDTSLSSCTSTLVNATSLFGAAATSGSTPSASDVTTALSAICGSSPSCSSTTVQSELAKFYSACTPELTSNPNENVLQTYDVLYSIIPMQNAICTKGDDGNYCVTEMAANSTSSSTSSSLSAIAHNLWSTVSSVLAVGRRDDASSGALITPNATTFATNNLPFLLLQPTLTSASLCKTCTRNILMSYITFESNIPYAAGLAQSPLLRGQTSLYQGVQTTCGANFLNGAVQAASNLSGGLLGKTNGALRAIGGNVGAVGVAMAATVLGAMWIL